MRIEREGGVAAWLVGTLAVPSVQGHRLSLPQELWPYQSLFFQPLVAGDQKASLASLCNSTGSGTQGSLAWGPSLLFPVSGT